MRFLNVVQHVGEYLMRNWMQSRLLVEALFFLPGQFLATNAHAFQNGVCRQDVKRFCPNVRIGAGRLTTCMYENAPKLLPVCRVEILAAWEQLNAFKSACAKDAAKLCDGVQSGHARVYSFLKMDRKAVSETCNLKL